MILYFRERHDLIAPALHPEEKTRLEALQTMCVLDTPPVHELDRVTRMAGRLFDVPIALVSLVDADRQWFKSKVGLDAPQTPRDISFCGHAILAPGALVVRNALRDVRFADNPLVTGEPHIRFYAGQPIRSLEGQPIGTLCLISPQPREFSDTDAATLRDLAAIVEQYFQQQESFMRAHRAERELAHTQTLFEKTFEHAGVGIAIVSTEGQWLRVNQQLSQMLGYTEAQLLAKTFQDITHPDDLPKDLALVGQVLAGEISTYTLEKRYFHADGHVVWILLTVSLMHDEFDKTRSFIAIINDISQRKIMESELLTLQGELEQRVMTRTLELSTAVAQLREEMELRSAMQQSLQLEKERFRLTLANATDAFIELDPQGNVTAWNQAAEQVLGWTRDEVLHQPVRDLIIPPALRVSGRKGFDQFIDTRPSDHRHMQFPALRKDGSEFPAELTLAENTIEGQRIVNAFLRDISQRKADEQEILSSRWRLRLLTDNMPGLICHVDEHLHYQFTNRTYENWFGGSNGSLIGKHMLEVVDETAMTVAGPYIAQALAGKQVSYENCVTRAEGTRYTHTTLVPDIRGDGYVQGFYLLSQDITERKNLENRLAFEAEHDPLTGLPNRRAFMRILHDTIARSRRTALGVALLFLDLDGFKQINDTLGHEFGDKVLQTFATTLSHTVRETDVVTRLAGDEFTIILEGLDSPEGAASHVASKVLARIAEVSHIDGKVVALRSSIGIATCTGACMLTAEQLLAVADAAMYRAKASGKHTFAVN
ncbi:diguanylate cyclase (GGDEF)-like protein/PAS domain S-box-containing protein [Silvimonas terrae]|uniref:Diguanylate cyclase (GGDEF)-like protein/PAS domain S-box-containing protein n=1 Tax=Silvimonas terrae TaxID=300266 RepID=A0A840RCS1_9NEIS|nr:PAS domain S-box protein [Silvimonas terrae]MBB5190150.1 diguanylate cyclase (GGDEF)-like protein/PAS domain S-box-containing protein [Silvimonas terrae]